jgi:citrate lyase subunit beta/citryl-CoA lyase
MEHPFESAGSLPVARIRRSELVCPAHSQKMMAKAAASGADEVILDLEDGCAPSQKDAARSELIHALKTLSFGDKVKAFRPNGVSSRYFYRDVISVVEAAGSHIDAVVLAKARDEGDVHFADRLLGQVEEAAGLPVGRIRLEVLIESARALVRAEAIARASPRTESLIFGMADYAADVGAKYTDADSFEVFHYARSQIVACARAYGLEAIDGVTFRYKDTAQVDADAKAGARLGFGGKWAIHPAQLDPIHSAYSPAPEELRRALEITQAYEKADARGLGAIAIGEEMVDAATVRVELRKIAIARKAGLLGAL